MNRSAQERLAVGLLKGWSNVYCIKLMPLHYFKGNQNLFKHKQEHLPISFRTKAAKKNIITSVHYYTTTTKNKIQQLKLWKHMFNSIVKLLEPCKITIWPASHINIHFKHDSITPMISVCSNFNSGISIIAHANLSVNEAYKQLISKLQNKPLWMLIRHYGSSFMPVTT